MRGNWQISVRNETNQNSFVDELCFTFFKTKSIQLKLKVNQYFQVIFFFPLPTPAPVPRCSPLFIINKLAEFNNLMSDSNPYFPVPPCEYGNAMNALRAGDFRSVFVLAEPTKIPLHNFYELVWFLKTGFPRFMRMVTGKQKFITNPKILRERYKHHTP